MLTLEAIQEKSPYKDRVNILNFPSIMAEAPAPTVSDRYQFLSPATYIPIFERENWYPYSIRETRANKEGNSAFTKHAISFMNPDMEKSLTPTVGEVYPMIRMIGAHDATTSLQAFLEAWRVWCSNGCATPSKLGGGKAKHIGDDFYDTVAGIIADTLQRTPQLASKITSWRNIDLTPDAREAFAEEAITLRWDADSGAYVDPRSILRPKRQQDRSNDLWTTYSVIQEKMLKGGVPVLKPDEKGRYRRKDNGQRVRNAGSKAITSVSTDTKLNQALWSLTERMEEILTK